MNLSALPELLLAWVKTQGAALLQGNKAEQASPFKVGVEYEGKVLDLLPSGRHLVQVAGQKLDMGLPQNTRTGDSVRLTYLSGGPRPTFLMHAQAQMAPVQPVQISSTAQQVNALMRIAQPVAQPVTQTSPASPPPPSGQASAGTTAAGAVSPGAQAAASARAGGGAVPATGNATAAPSGQAMTRLPPAVPPLEAAPAAKPAGPSANVAAPGATVAQVRGAGPAQGAQHLAMASGQAPAQASAMRPIVANVVMLQGFSAVGPNSPTAVASANTALLGQAVDQLRAGIAPSTTLRPTVVADPAVPSPNLLPTRLAQTVRESGLFYESHLARWTKGGYPFESILNEPQARFVRNAMPMPGMAELGSMPEEAARMAGRQLHMLEGGPFLWQGFAWPGQWMDWLVEERREGQGDGEPGEEPNPWATELRLTLPHMGTVNAQLSLQGHKVSLRLQAAESGAVQAMTNALPDLQRGLETSGLLPVSLAVAQEDG